MDEQEYNMLQDMFLTDGWRLFTEILEDKAANAESISNLKCSEDLWFAKGTLTTLEYILSFENAVSLQYSAEHETH